MINNASAYYVSIQEDTPISTAILNYTVFINEAAIGQPDSISLSLSSNNLAHRSFSFDNGFVTKSYSSGSLPEGYTVVNNTASFQEQISITSSVSNAFFNMISMLTLLTEVNAAATSEYESDVFIAVYNSSGDIACKL